MEEKRHYKLYKSGKNWVVASIAAITVLSGSGLASTALNVHADTAPVATATSKTVNAAPAAQSNINFSALKAQLVWSNAKAANASIYSSATGKTLVAKLQADIKTANGYMSNPASTTQAKVNAIITSLKNDGIALNNEVASILNGQLFWSNKKQASDYVTAQGKTLWAQFQKDLATANSYVKNPSLATPENVNAITATLHKEGLALYASKVSDLTAPLATAKGLKATDYTTDAGKKAFATLTTDIATAEGYVASPEFATPAQIQAITDKLVQDGKDLAATNQTTPSVDKTTLAADVVKAQTATVGTTKVSDALANNNISDATSQNLYFTVATWSTFSSAYNAAIATLKSSTASASDVSSADSTLNSALGNLGVATNGLDKVKLSTALATAAQYSALGDPTTGTVKYTSATWTAFTSALRTANGSLATQKAINTAADNLNSAITNLKVLVGNVDKSQLEADIASASKLTNPAADGTVYTQVSWQALQDAIAAANKVDADKQATQGATSGAAAGTVNGADAALVAAMTVNAASATTGLNKQDKTVVDSSLLAQLNRSSAVSNAAVNGQVPYTIASYNKYTAAFTQAKTDGQALFNDQSLKDSTLATGQAKVDAAVKEYNDAKALLVPATTGLDKSQLEADIATATTKFPGNINPDGTHIYKSNLWAAFTTALTNAKAADKNATAQGTIGSADATTINGTDKALANAIAALLPADNSAKNTLTQDDVQVAADYKTATTASDNLTAANGGAAITTGAAATATVAAGTYTQASWTAYVNALKAVEALYSAGTKVPTTGTGTGVGLATGVTQTQIDTADTNLNNAFSGLTADYTALNAEIKTASAMSNVNADGTHIYDNTSWQALQDTITAAKALVNANNALQGSATATAATVSSAKFADGTSVNAALAALKAAEIVKTESASTGLVAATKGSINDILAGSYNLAGATSSTAFANSAALYSAAQDIVNAKNGVTDGSYNYTYTTASFAQLKTAFANVDALMQTAGTDSSVASLKSGVTQGQFDANFAALKSALNNLVSVANGTYDLTAITPVINQANALVSSDWTAYSFANVTAALTALNADIKAATKQQSDINTDAANVTATINQLVKSSKSQLQADYLYAKAIAPADALTLSPITSNGIAYKAALDAANGVLFSSLANADQVAAADQALQAAIASVTK